MTDSVVFERMKRKMGEIDEAARRNGCTLLIAFGMDPGLDLMLGADALSRMDEIEHFYSYARGSQNKSHVTMPCRTDFLGLLAVHLFLTFAKQRRLWMGRW